MAFVPCVKWIQKGVAKSIPDKIQLTSQELQAIWGSRKEEIKLATESTEEMPCNLRGNNDKYNFEGYDNDSENIQSTLGIETLVSMDSSQQMVEEDIDSEAEDEVIHPHDNLIVVGHVQDDASVLEVYVYNEEEGDLYVHHDILIPSIPLCVEWLNFEPSQQSPGNLVAVGGMCPEIMVWDLDIVNCLEPAFKLGKYSKKKSKAFGRKNIGHEDDVMDISWNKNVSHILASASVDESVIVWDIEYGKIGLHLTDFTDNVQCIKWHPSETQILLSGCCDRYARMFDCRLDPAITRWQVNGEIECLCWNPDSAQSSEALIGTNNGMIHCLDTRTNKFKWQLTAHEKEITGLSVHHMCPEIMTTCATDGLLKIWDISKNSPFLLSSISLNSGELHCLDLNPDIPYLACTGGSKKRKVFAVSDLRKQISDHQRFYWGQEGNHLPLSSLKGKSSSHMESAAAESFNKKRPLTKKNKLKLKKNVNGQL